MTNIIDPAQSDQGLYCMQFSLSTPQTVKSDLFNFWNDFSNNSQCLNFHDFYDV